MGDTGNALLGRHRHHRRALPPGPHGRGPGGEHLDRERGAAPQLVRVDPPRTDTPSGVGSCRCRASTDSAPSTGCTSATADLAVPGRGRARASQAARGRRSAVPDLATVDEARRRRAARSDVRAASGHRTWCAASRRGRGAGRGRQRELLPRASSTIPRPAGWVWSPRPGPAPSVGSRTRDCSSSFDRTPGVIQRGPCMCGEHTREILLELGYDDAGDRRDGGRAGDARRPGVTEVTRRRSDTRHLRRRRRRRRRASTSSPPTCSCPGGWTRHRRTVMVCVPGGGISRRVLRPVACLPSLGNYSMARHLARQRHSRGDHRPAGVGDSDTPEDPYELTPGCGRLDAALRCRRRS